MRVTMREVATKAGVSAMTVSRVINESPRVSDEVRRRVEAAIADLGYVPNRLARGLIRQKTGALGLIVPDVANPFFTLVVRGAEEVAWRAGYHVILCNTQADIERERGYIEDMLSFQVEGLLLAPVGERSRPNLRVLRKNNVPFVLIDRTIGGYDGDLVQGDSVGGARQLVEHLIGLGHRRIGMVTETAEVSTARDRLEGYRQALEHAGIAYSPELVLEASATDVGSAHDATLALLDLPEPPTAIFSVNNIAVVGVAEAARERGLRIPEDIAVVCFDDIEHASRFHPFLTVMAQPAETFGTIATQLLLDRLAGRIEQRRRLVVLPADFVVRESSGAQLPERA
ncbi:MAG TPA: LacI family DNA-binding transcriptional regulator [Gaiellaceae bacterium]|nr:LacI family DNA-binding transcriptional regulator [Gaiellaceae bacterium]